MKWLKQPATYLILILVTSSLVMTAAGLVIKHTTAKESQQVKHTLAIAVPFMMLRGEVMDLEAPRKVYPVPERLLPPLGAKEVEEELPEEVNFWEAPRAFTPADTAYFNDVLFIGDSRTVGLSVYGRLGSADYFADVGMSVFNLFDKTMSDAGYSNASLRSLLEARQYHTIYIMLGINELGYPLEAIDEQMRAVLGTICSMQPETNIVLIANLPVTKKKAERTEHLAIERIWDLNEMISSYADGHQILYLWSNPDFLTEEGYLKPEVTGDGAHPYALDYERWSQWIMGYGVTVREEVPPPEPTSVFLRGFIS